MPSLEKLRLAREIHDGIAQDLVALGYGIDLLLARPLTPVETREGLRGLRFDISSLLEKMRKEIFELRDTKDLETNLRTAAIRGGFSGTLDIQIESLEVADDVSIAIDRFSSELLRNSLTHSGATTIDISLRSDDAHIYLEVGDNGVGGAQMIEGRFGIKGIIERVEILNGEISIISTEIGTRVTITL